MSFQSFPVIVGWELTLHCNLRCRHCGSSAASPRAGELTNQEAQAICDQLPALLVHEVDFTGGEPLLRPDWADIARRLRSHGIQTKVVSNGLLLNQENVATLKDLDFAAVGVSLDGLEQTHDNVRNRPGLFRKVVAGIERVLKAGIHVTVITTVSGRNVGELDSLAPFLRSLGVTHWQIQPIFPLGRAANAPDLHLSDQAYMAMGAFVSRCSALPFHEGPEILPGDSFGYFTDFDRREPPWRGCSAGLITCGITSDGKIKGCLSMPDTMVEGDLRQNDLWDIWFGPNAFVYNRSFHQEDLGSNCRNCIHAVDCLGGCTSMSLGATGRPHNDPFCFYRLQQARVEPSL